MNSLELMERKAGLVSECKKFLDGIDNRELTAEEQTEWQRRNDEIDAIEVDLGATQRRERVQALEANLRTAAPRKTQPTQPGTVAKTVTRSDRNKALKNWLAYGRNVPGFNGRYDGETLHRNSEAGYSLQDQTVDLHALRSINEGSNSAGGYSTFTTTSPDIQTELKYFSPIASKVNVVQTGNGNQFSLVKGTDVANQLSIVSEGDDSPDNVDPSFARVNLSSYLFRGIELVTYEMLADAVFDIEGWVTSRLAERAARTIEAYVVAGTGSSQPTGLVKAALVANSNSANVTLASGHSSLYRFDDLYSLFSKVDPAYRPNCTLCFHDSSLWDLRNVKDSQSRPVWDINNSLYQNAPPDRIGGYQFMISNSMDASAQFSKNLAVFADLSRYTLRLVGAPQITRLNELYRSSGMIGIEVMLRFDGNYIGHAASIAVLATPGS